VTCEENRTVLHAYLDGELDASRSAEFEKHLEGCVVCVRALEAQESLRSAIQRANLYEPLPGGLEAKVRRQLREASAPSSVPRIFAWRWLAAAVGLLLVIGLSWKYLPLHRGEANLSASAFASEIVDAHIRSLQPGHLADIASTDRHTVKPWFDGKVAFAPPVKDFTEEGFPLIGGRLDVLQGQNVAALVYGRRKHFINVFVWPERAGETEQYTGSKNGYNWISWQQGELRLCAVSDTNRDDLAALKDLINR
jgi:mycothiol system anti-sigma-R factor